MLTIQTNNGQCRRFDLDWLRIIVFMFLILYHVGMMYVENWGFHIKSAYLSSTLESFMLVLNQWRLPLLFVISGIAIAFVLEKVSVWRFMGMRSLRLLVPLIFGMLVIVPPQLYFEMTSKGQLDMSFSEFLPLFYQPDNPLFAQYKGMVGHIDVNHLWFIRELWWFSMLLMIFIPVLNSSWFTGLKDKLKGKAGAAALLILPVMALMTIGLTAMPELGEGYRVRMYFMFTVLGYVIGFHQGIWQLLTEYRRVFLVIAVAGCVVVLVKYNFLDQGFSQYWWVNSLDFMSTYINRCAWIFAILGYGARYLNHNHRYLPQLNEAVLPFFILHQTLTIAIGFHLSKFAVGPVLEPVLVIAGTFIGCCLLYLLICRVGILRWLFGMKYHPLKDKKSDQEKPQAIQEVCHQPDRYNVTTK